MKKVLTQEVFEEIMRGLKEWIISGLDSERSNEILKLANDYFIQSSFTDRFGEEIDVEEEVANIEDFYTGYFKTSDEKFYFFKRAVYKRKYKQLQDRSFKLAQEVLRKGNTSQDLIYDTKEILGNTEKLNLALEKEDKELQEECLKIAKEIFLNCMFISTNDKTVLGNQVGELLNLKGMVDELKE